MIMKVLELQESISQFELQFLISQSNCPFTLSNLYSLNFWKRNMAHINRSGVLMIQQKCWSLDSMKFHKNWFILANNVMVTALYTRPTQLQEHTSLRQIICLAWNLVICVLVLVRVVRQVFDNEKSCSHYTIDLFSRNIRMTKQYSLEMCFLEACCLKL